MLRQTRSRTHGEADKGFTLVELLIVTLIIGILAAIAIPVFLQQRSKEDDAAAKSDLRNLANFEEIYFNDFNRYASVSDVIDAEPKMQASPTITLRVVFFDGENSYCLSAKAASSDQTWYYDSRGGGLQPQTATGCSVTTSGTSGGKVTG